MVIRAPDGGALQVTTNDDDVVLYRGRLREGDVVVVDPRRNCMTVNGDPVDHGRLRKRHNHRIWFRPDSKSFKEPQWRGHQE